MVLDTAGMHTGHLILSTHDSNSGAAEVTRFGVCTTLRETRQQTRVFVDHYVALGANRMWLFFDDPDDPAIEEVAGWPGVTAVRCDSEHWGRLGGRKNFVPKRQSANIGLAMEWALQESVDWLMNVDSDEFVFADPTWLRALLGGADWDVVALPPLEVIPLLDSGDMLGRRQFKVSPLRRLERYGRLPGADGLGHSHKEYRRKLDAFEASGGRKNIVQFNAHQVGKAIIRVDPALYGRIGQHVPRPSGSEPLDVRLVPGCRVLHYDGHDLASWKRKWLNLADGTFANRTGGIRETQMADFRAVLARSGPDGLDEFFVERYLPTSSELEMAVDLGLVKELERPIRATSAG